MACIPCPLGKQTNKSHNPLCACSFTGWDPARTAGDAVILACLPGSCFPCLSMPCTMPSSTQHSVLQLFCLPLIGGLATAPQMAPVCLAGFAARSSNSPGCCNVRGHSWRCALSLPRSGASRGTAPDSGHGGCWLATQQGCQQAND